MKLSLASRVLDFVGRRLIGEPNALFGTPPGALDQLYLVPADRTGHETLDPEQVHNAVWLRQRAAVIFLRRNLQWRAGMAVSAAILPIVCAGLLLAGGISASTSGIRNAWQKHEAAAAQAKAQADAEAQQPTATPGTQARAIGQGYGANPNQTKAKAQADAEAQQIAGFLTADLNSCERWQGLQSQLAGDALKKLQDQGCDIATGTLDMVKAKAWATGQAREAAAAQATVDAEQVAGMISAQITSARHDCQMQQITPVTGEDLQNLKDEGCDIATGTLDMVKAKAWATKKAKAGQW